MNFKKSELSLLINFLTKKGHFENLPEIPEFSNQYAASHLFTPLLDSDICIMTWLTCAVSHVINKNKNFKGEENTLMENIALINGECM